MDETLRVLGDLVRTRVSNYHISLDYFSFSIWERTHDAGTSKNHPVALFGAVQLVVHLSKKASVNDSNSITNKANSRLSLKVRPDSFIYVLTHIILICQICLSIPHPTFQTRWIGFWGLDNNRANLRTDRLNYL